MFSHDFLKDFVHTIKQINPIDIENMASLILKTITFKGRLFILGVGGSAGNASHAVNDFRKLVNIEAYAPTDNVCELTARTNDEGWDSVFLEWLKVSRLNNRDSILILSVGGGDLEKNVSVNLINSANYAKEVGCNVLCIVGRYGGEIKKIANCTVHIPLLHETLVTPITESAQSVILHLLVTHPLLAKNPTKW